MERLFSTVVYIFDGRGNTLFLNHKKLGKWLPPGGKVDPNELPQDAVIGECVEETGLTIELVGERTKGSNGLMMPHGMELNVIIPGKREHIDFVFCGRPTGSLDITVNELEAAEVRWFPVHEVLDPAFNTFESTKEWVKIFAQRFEQGVYMHAARSMITMREL